MAKTMDSSPASALRRLEALFDNVRLNKDENESIMRSKSPVGKQSSGMFETFVIEERVDKNCDIHGRDSRKSNYGLRRGSMGNVLHGNSKSETFIRRESSPAIHIVHNHPVVGRRESSGLRLPPSKCQDPLVHPSSFPSSLRKSSVTTSTNNLRRDSNGSSTVNLRGTARRDSISSVGSGRSGSSGRRESLGRRLSTDSLELTRSSWDLGRRGSSSSSGGLDESLLESSVDGKVGRNEESGRESAYWNGKKSKGTWGEEAWLSPPEEN
ncbi:hypothetical protein RUM44_009988 [Polyplax serrata]|uniref:Uncharacterized protein n=1 Tax=Polyplax serrata TaxID=468196 RepID=A0ABR1AU93_POLSC